MLIPRRSYIAGFHDILIAAISFFAALYLRLSALVFRQIEDYVPGPLLLFLVVFAITSYGFRMQRAVWRYVSLRELFLIAKVATVSVLVFYVILFLTTRLEGFPRSVLLIHWMVLMAGLAGPRILYRAWRDRSVSVLARSSSAVPVLLLGMRSNAEQFIRDQQQSQNPLYRVVGIIDEDAAQHGRTIHGIPIQGALEGIPRAVEKLERNGEKPQRLILGEDYLDGEQVSRVVDMASELGIPVSRLPRMTDLRQGQAGLDIRPVEIEDLLGRAQNVHERERMQRFLEGKTVLITGAGGSIGGELARQVALCKPKRIILFELSEFNLYTIDQQVEGIDPALERISILGDVRNAHQLSLIFQKFKPEIVFHAAAIKHVPIGEMNPTETVLTNVMGTVNVARASDESGAEAMVLISTDKAVNPTNIMGASKRLAELYLGSRKGSKTRYITVRFGNVLGSAGSVVPLFQKQIAAGGPITVTHPDITRFFMTIREAVELVIVAGERGMASNDSAPRTFVLDMGRPIKIVELAERMIRLAGAKTEIKFTGLREGEKLYEELFYDSEQKEATDARGVVHAISEMPGSDLLDKAAARLISACEQRNVSEALSIVKELVPQYETTKK